MREVFLPIKWRSLIAVSLSALAVGVCVIFADQAVAAGWLRYYGYYFTWVSSIGLLALLGVAVLQGDLSRSNFTWLINRSGLTACALGCAFIFLQADFGYKIVMDEYLLASTAENLHRSGEVVVTPAQIQDPAGNELVPLQQFTDKRPWFYPFLVSVLHDLLGFREVNSFLLNGCIGVALVITVGYFGNGLWAGAGAWLAILLMASLPLVAQNATGGGMELLNLWLLILLMVMAATYLEQPTRAKEGLLCLVAVLLAYTRYESTLFIFPTAVVVIRGWFRRGRSLLSVATLLTPLLLIAAGWQVIGYMGASSGWELTRDATKPFATEHFFSNLPHALNFLTTVDGSLANSPLLALCGLVALVAAPMLIRHNRVRFIENPFWLSTLIFAPFIMLQFSFMLGFHASRLDSPFVSRYALPFCWLLVLSTIILGYHLVARHPARARALILLVGLYGFAYTIPTNAKAIFTQRNFAVNEQEWLMLLAEEELPAGTLWIDSVTLQHVLAGRAVITPNRATANREWLQAQLKDGVYPAVMRVERLVLNGRDFESTGAATFDVGGGMEFERFKERSFRPFTLTRVHITRPARDQKMNRE